MNGDLAALVDDLVAGGSEATAVGELLHARMSELYPLPRSLTGASSMIHTSLTM